MATVIDSLIVTLGLDPANFKKGTNEATRQTKLTQEQFKKSGEAMTKSITDVARNIFVAFVGFESASGLVSFLGRLNQAQATLSRLSLNLGTSARALDVWDKKIELAGGTVQGAQGAIQQLMADATALQTTGQVSPLLVFFNKLGVTTAATAFSADKAQSAYEELFKSLAKLPRATANQLAAQAGINPDVLAYGLRPEAEQRGITAEAERLSRATDANAKAADDLRMRWEAIKLQLEGIGIALLEKITPTVERLLPIVERLTKRFGDWIQSFKTDDPKNFAKGLEDEIDSLLDKIEKVRQAVGRMLHGDFSDVKAAVASSFNSPGEAWAQFKAHDPIFGSQPTSALSMLKNFFVGMMPYQKEFNAASEKYKLPAGLLRGIAQTESNFDPNAVSPKGAVGLMQLMPKYFPGAGKDPAKDIETAAQYLRQLYEQFKDWDAAVAAYNAGPTRISSAIAGSATVPRETVDYVAKVAQNINSVGPGRSASPPAPQTNTIRIDHLTIQSNAPDGKGVAVDFMAEMKKRKDLVWQLDSGLTP